MFNLSKINIQKFCIYYLNPEKLSNCTSVASFQNKENRPIVSRYKSLLFSRHFIPFNIFGFYNCKEISPSRTVWVNRSFVQPIQPPILCNYETVLGARKCPYRRLFCQKFIKSWTGTETIILPTLSLKPHTTTPTKQTVL